MEWMRQWTAQIQAQLAGLTASQKMLIGTLLVVIPVMLLLVVRYAAVPQMAPILDQAMDPAGQARITAYLDTQRIGYRIEGDRVLVPIEDRRRVAAALAAQQLLPEDTSAGFAAIIENQSWWQSSEQNRQMYNIALQGELVRVLRENPWVRNATVIISQPRDTGFGAATQRPTASVNIVMESGHLDQHKVDAIAGLISGAVAEMKPQDVIVIDSLVGRQWKTRTEGDILPTDYLELIDSQERYYREKLASALTYIDKVIVAVNVEVDLARKIIDTTSYNRDTSIEMLTSERTLSTQTIDPQDGGAPGVRANTGANIAGVGGSDRTSTTEETESTFEPRAGMTHESIRSPGGVPTSISATVNVPRSFFVARFMQGKDADTPQPTDEVLAPIIDEHLGRIRKQIEPLVSSKDDGQVVVGVYPDGVPGMIPDGGTPDAPNATPLMASGYVKMMGLGALALVSLAMMMLMVRKASQKPHTPSAEELAGVPPTLARDEEAISDADEMDAPLAGVELDDDTLRHRKLTEQVAAMVKDDPAEIATLIQRWVKRPE